MQQIADWLKQLGMSEYAERFAENGINVAALPHLTDQDLKDIGVLLGHRRILLAAIGEITGAAPATPEPAFEAKPKAQHTAERLEPSTPAAAPSPPIPAVSTVAGERRYLTVLNRPGSGRCGR
jgi:SAM domain (Sterile alpha motif)